MGQCTTACGKYVKANQDINLDDIDDEYTKKQKLNEKYSSKDYYSKVIFLQLRIKRFLIKNKRKKTCALNRVEKERQIINNKNINVSINVNVNMSRPSENSNLDNKEEAISNNFDPNRNQTVQGSFIVIPAVKTDFKESQIFSQDPFLKTKKQIKHNNKDPRDGPFDSQRREFPKVIEDEYSYTGQWKNGKRDGLGVLAWKEISKYVGEFKDDRVFGFGKLFHEDGDTYTGYWNDFQAQGIGTYKTKKDASFEGYWEKDRQNGFGIETWPRGSHYRGEYINGNKEGLGVLNFEGNGGYEGEFKSGGISGVGTFFFKDKRKYQGEWKNNKMHGYGIIIWPDGKFYEGEFYDDKKEGFGVFYSHKKIYMGIWKNSMLEGDTIIIEGKKRKKQYWEGGKAARNLPIDKPIFFEKFVDEIIAYKEKMDLEYKSN